MPLIQLDNLILNTEQIELVDLQATRKSKDGSTTSGLVKVFFAGRSQPTWFGEQKAYLIRQALNELVELKVSLPQSPSVNGNGHQNGNQNGNHPTSQIKSLVQKEINQIIRGLPQTNIPCISIHTRQTLLKLIEDRGWRDVKTNAPIIASSLIGKHFSMIENIGENEGLALIEWFQGPTAEATINSLWPA